MKRYEGKTKPEPRTQHEKGYKPIKRSHTLSESSARRDSTGDVNQENKCLIRAALNKKKISTIVSAKEMNRFQVAYSNLLKGNLHGIKKKEKKVRVTGKPSPKGTSKATRE
jgi:signal recognition particle subunit SRP14